jgi:hypothetical protein
MALSFGEAKLFDVSGVDDSDVGPSLAGYLGGQIWAMWKGSNGDSKVYYSSLANEGSSWYPKQTVPGIGTSYRPALARYDNGSGAVLLYAAWKGEADDQRIWYSSFNGTSWAAQQLIPGESTVGPSLATCQTASGPVLYAAWKGSDADERIWYSTYGPSSTWSPQTVLPDPIRSSHGPSLWYYDGRMFAAWKGSGTDETLYWASLDLSTQVWSEQTQMNTTIKSSVGPSLVGVGYLYAIYKGPGNDTTIWYTIYDPVQPGGFGLLDALGKEIPGVQAMLPGAVGTDVGLSIAVDNLFQMFAGWKVNNDVKLYWRLVTNNMS